MDEAVTWVQVDGRAGQDNCGNIKSYLRNRFDQGVRHFVIDLEKCCGIDSTFIGMLYRLACDIEDTGADQGGVEIIHSCERNATSIRKLGLDAKIQLQSDCSHWDSTRDEIEAFLKEAPGQAALGKAERTEMILESHEALAEVSPENREQFDPLLDLLKKEIEEEQ